METSVDRQEENIVVGSIVPDHILNIILNKEGREFHENPVTFRFGKIRKIFVSLKNSPFCLIHRSDTTFSRDFT